MLKDVDALLRSDPRYRDLLLIDEAGTCRQMQISDLHSMMRSIELSPGVPEDVRIEFDTARNAFVYSWFVYELATLAEAHSFGALELALRSRLDPSEQATKSASLSRLLRAATKRGLLQREEFAMPSPSGSGELSCRLDLLPKLRNHIAHGNAHLLPQATPDNIRLCADVINALFRPNS